MQLMDQDAVQFLIGRNSVRDGTLVSLSVREGESESDRAIGLTFHVPRGTEGDVYDLQLRGDLQFEYVFSSEHSLDQIEMVKCLWTDDGVFYLSLDPWDERETVISKDDNDWFRSKSVMLSVGWSARE